MVTVAIFMEGGELPHANQPAMTFNNSARLRQSMHELLLQVFDEEKFDLQVRIGGGEKSAKNLFIKALEEHKESILLIDVYKDATKADKLKRLGIEEKADQVFFMEREMEAWIISQCACIEACAELENWTREKASQPLEEDKNLAGKDIAKIPQPSNVLKIILGRYYSTIKKNKKVKQKYGKLKHAPTMIEHLNLPQLKQDFTEVGRLLDYISNKQ
ncbi:MAG: DUF4276 family protein [Aureispira sp.]